jgi:hypothetical protein
VTRLPVLRDEAVGLARHGAREKTPPIS